MAVTPDDIAERLGLPSSGLTEALRKQIEIWIAEANLLISTRAREYGVTLDSALVDLVVSRAVTAMARRPNDETQVDVAVDDGRVSKRYSSSTGVVTITDEWWDLLGLGMRRGAFTIRPSGQAGYASYGGWR